MNSYLLQCKICKYEDSCDQLMLPFKLNLPCPECGGVMAVIKNDYDKETE